MRRALVVALALGSLVGAAVFAPNPASADCSGPTIWYTPGSIARGDIVSVRGTGWGDNCYDTGPPPQGQGVFGEAIAGITISLQQDAKQVRVARGAADDAYKFEVSFRAPTKLKPGPVTVVATWSGGNAYVVPAAPFLITADRPASGSRRTEVARFGETTTPTTTRGR